MIDREPRELAGSDWLPDGGPRSEPGTSFSKQIFEARRTRGPQNSLGDPASSFTPPLVFWPSFGSQGLLRAIMTVTTSWKGLPKTFLEPLKRSCRVGERVLPPL